LNTIILDVVTFELDRRGIPHTITHGGKHAKVSFVVDGRPRHQAVSLSPSDHRAPRNALSELRRKLPTEPREDKAGERARKRPRGRSAPVSRTPTFEWTNKSDPFAVLANFGR